MKSITACSTIKEHWVSFRGYCYGFQFLRINSNDSQTLPVMNTSRYYTNPGKLQTIFYPILTPVSTFLPIPVNNSTPCFPFLRSGLGGGGGVCRFRLEAASNETKEVNCKWVKCSDLLAQV